MRFSAGLLIASLAVSPALAAETGGCGAFKWPVSADIALLAQAKNTENGATLDVAAPSAIRLRLATTETAGFEKEPEKPAPKGGPAGVLKFEAKAGLYQITLTDRAWTDLVQNGEILRPKSFAGVLDCDGARKSLRYELKDGPALLQISGSPTTAIGVAVSPVKE